MAWISFCLPFNGTSQINRTSHGSKRIHKEHQTSQTRVPEDTEVPVRGAKPEWVAAEKSAIQGPIASSASPQRPRSFLQSSSSHRARSGAFPPVRESLPHAIDLPYSGSCTVEIKERSLQPKPLVPDGSRRLRSFMRFSRFTSHRQGPDFMAAKDPSGSISSPARRNSLLYRLTVALLPSSTGGITRRERTQAHNLTQPSEKPGVLSDEPLNDRRPEHGTSVLGRSLTQHLESVESGVNLETVQNQVDHKENSATIIRKGESACS